MSAWVTFTAPTLMVPILANITVHAQRCRAQAAPYFWAVDGS